MKRTISILSLAFVMTVAGIAQTAAVPQIKPEHLSKGQLNSLITNAKTPADHHRLAAYYQAKAQEDLAQANEHQKMVTAFKTNGVTNNKNQAGTIDHCAFYVQEFKNLAAKNQELARQHEKMAVDAKL